MSKEAMKEKFQEAKTKFVKTGKKAYDTFENFVKEHPYLAVGLTAAVSSGVMYLAGKHDINSLKKDAQERGLWLGPTPFKNREDERRAQTIWEEHFKDNFYNVKHAIEAMTLSPGETYIISNTDDQKFIFQTDSKNFSYKDSID